MVDNAVGAVDGLFDVDVECANLADKVVADVQLEELGEIFGNNGQRVEVDVAIEVLGAVVLDGEVFVATVDGCVERLLQVSAYQDISGET